MRTHFTVCRTHFVVMPNFQRDPPFGTSNGMPDHAGVTDQRVSYCRRRRAPARVP